MVNLNDHLFMQLEKLNDDELKGEELEAELDRAKGMTDLAGQITEGMKLQLSAAQLVAKHGDRFRADLEGLSQTPDSSPRLAQADKS